MRERLDLSAKRAAETSPAVVAQNVTAAGERIKARPEKAGAAVELKAA